MTVLEQLKMLIAQDKSLPPKTASEMEDTLLKVCLQWAGGSVLAL